MNKYLKLIILALLFVSVGFVHAEDNQLKHAADLYAAQSYEEAADVYAEILEKQRVSPDRKSVV